MVTKRISQALMITATMIISATVAEAQRVNRDALLELSQGREPSAGARVPAPAPESDVAMEPAAAGQEASQGGSHDIVASHQKAIVGSWLDTVSVTGGPTFDSLSTYTRDGGWVFSDQGSVITDPSFPHVFSAGHGVWVHQGGRKFRQTARQLISDLNGGLLARLKLRETLTLDASGDAYRTVWKAEFTDPAGNLIASFEGTRTGQRIKIEPLP